jgi:Glycosyl hydrolase family 12
MTAQFVSCLVAPTLLASVLGACASGSDAPYTGGTSTVGGVAPNSTVSPVVAVTPVPRGDSFDLSKRFGTPTMAGTGNSTEQYKKTDVVRDGKNYYFMSNGWGPGYTSQSVEWDGTAFTVLAMEGEQGPLYQPATYPTVFCGIYSDSKSKECGLPKDLATITSLRTGWSWTAADTGSHEEYNAAYDIWLANGPTKNDFSGFFMVWLREPRGQQPAGSFEEGDVTVANVPGVWDIWTGEVDTGGTVKPPIINYVRAEGDDTPSLEFDVMDFIRDAQTRGYEVPGTHVLSVAVGFEIWNGPITNLKSNDFYVEVQ